MANYSTWVNDNPDMVNAAAQRVGQQPALAAPAAQPVQQQPVQPVAQAPQQQQQPTAGSRFNQAATIAQAVTGGGGGGQSNSPGLAPSAYNNQVQSDAPRQVQGGHDSGRINKILQIVGSIFSFGASAAGKENQSNQGTQGYNGVTK